MILKTLLNKNIQFKPSLILLVKNIFLVAAFSILSACGGGSSGESTPKIPTKELPVGWEELTNMPRGLAHFAAINIDNKIYLAGGYDRKTSLYIYDIDTNSWSNGADLMRGTDSLKAIEHQGKMYLFGGEATKTVQVYDPSTGQWTESYTLPSHKFSSVTEKVDNNVHLIGGWNYNNDNSNSLSRHQVFDLDLKDTLSSELAPLMVARNCASSGIIDNKIVVTGGRSPGIRKNDSSALSSTEVYDLSLDGWDYAADLNTPRACSAHTVLDNKLYVFGGIVPPSTFTKSIERYNIANNSWDSIGEMPIFTSGSVAVTVGSSIYIFGGYFNSDSAIATTQESNKAFKFTPSN
jgi:N-acetylneuraminic acid mutarotase